MIQDFLLPLLLPPQGDGAVRVLALPAWAARALGKESGGHPRAPCTSSGQLCCRCHLCLVPQIEQLRGQLVEEGEKGLYIARPSFTVWPMGPLSSQAHCPRTGTAGRVVGSAAESHPPASSGLTYS